jgi:hypothetical protein
MALQERPDGPDERRLHVGEGASTMTPCGVVGGAPAAPCSRQPGAWMSEMIPEASNDGSPRDGAWHECHYRANVGIGRAKQQCQLATARIANHAHTTGTAARPKYSKGMCARLEGRPSAPKYRTPNAAKP